MSKLVFVFVHPIHYNDYLFHKIYKEGIDIQVFFTNKSLQNYPWKEKLNYPFPNRNCDYFLGIDWQLIKLAVFSRNTIFIIAGWDTFFKIMLFLTLIIFRKKYVLFTDTIKINGSKNFLKKSVRSLLINTILSNSYKNFTTGEIGVKTMNLVYNSSKTINFPFATDLNYFSSTPDFSNFSKEKILFSSGRLLNSHKGYDIAIKALKNIKDKGYDFKYYLAGTGPDQKMLEELIRKCGLQEQVFLLGWQELEDIKELYAKSHIFLHPSHLDPFPNAILEAMACGLIVVASDKAGSAVERITDNVSGYIFEDNSVTQLTEKIINVFESPKEKILSISQEAKAVSKKWDVSYHINIIKQTLA